MNRSILAVALALLAAGCSSPGAGGFRITEPKSLTSPMPARDSPAGVLRLLEWCSVNRDTATYRTLFTEDFVFVFGALDPNGNAYRTVPWTSEDERISFDHLVNGGDANQPPALDIDLRLDHDFRVTDNPFKPGAAHKLIRTSVTLKVVTGGEWHIQGFANFFLVRGDSAAIPDELRVRGFGPDSTQWWIERWEDDTFNEPLVLGTARVHGGGLPVTWGSLKVAYR